MRATSSGAAVRVLENNNNGNRNMRRVRKTALAEQDLEEIWLYIAADNIVAADALIDKLVEKSALLAANAELGRARPELHEGFAASQSAITSCFIAPKREVSSLHACCTVPVTSMPCCFRRDSME